MRYRYGTGMELRPKTNTPDRGRAIAASESYRAQTNRDGTPKHPIFGEPTQDDDPAAVLLDEIRRTAGTIQWLQQRIMESDPDRFVQSLWLRGRQSGFIRDEELDMMDWSHAGALWVDIYQKERAHLASICRTALAAGIEERRIRIAELLALKIQEAVGGMLLDLGVDIEDDANRAIVYKWLSYAQGIELDTQRVTGS